MMEVDTKVVDQKAVALLEDARQITVSNNKQYELAGAALKVIKSLQKEIKATFKPTKDAINESKAKILEAERMHLGPAEEAEKIIKKAMNDHHLEQKRLRDIEEAKIRKAQERQDRLRREAEEKNKPAPKLRPIAVAKTVIPKAKGIAQKTRMKFAIENFGILPAQYRMEVADLAKIQRDVDEFRMACDIKGVKVWEDSSIAAGSAR